MLGLGVGGLAALLASCSSAAVPPAARRATTSSGVSTAPQVTQPPKPTQVPTPTWPTTTVPLTGEAQSLAATVDAVYGLSVPQGDTQAAVPFRYDRGTHRLVYGPRLPDAEDLTVTGGWVWVVSPDLPPQDQASRVYRLDPATLDRRSVQDLPRSGDSAVVAATVGGPLWVATGSDLYSLDPTSGAIHTRRSLAGEITALATDPQGRYLYVADNTGGLTVDERDARSGTLVRQTTRPLAIAGGGLAATPGGVWITYRSGMLGQAERLDAASLARTAPSAEALTTPDSTYDETMGVVVSVSEGVAWVSAVHSLTCADPTTAAVRAAESAQVDGESAGRQLYAATTTGLAVIDPPALCYQ